MFKKLINYKYFLIIVLILASLLIFFTNQVTLMNFPNSADEYSYLIAAETFSNGKLSTPTHPHKEFFDFFHIINKEKFYSKYPPGWPFFLTLGIIINNPMLINLLFGILTLILTYKIAKENFSKKVGKLSVLLMAISPFFILNSASYHSHSSALFFAAISTYIYFKTLKTNKKSLWLFLGISIGIMFTIRPLDTVALTSAFLIYHTFTVFKNKNSLNSEIKNFLLLTLGFLAIFTIFLTYNYLQTGNPLLMPFNVYNPNEKLGFNKYSKSISWAIMTNIIARSVNLNIWIPICFFFIFIALKNKSKEKTLLALIPSFLLFAYFFYAIPFGNQYGPRYLYSSTHAIFILTALGVQKLRRKIPLILPIIIILNIILFYFASSAFHTQITHRTHLYDTVKQNNISNSLIFLDCGMCSGSMPSNDLTRNGIYFNNSVLYIHNRDNQNSLIQNYYPNKDSYTWSCEEIKMTYNYFLQMWLGENKNCSLKKNQSF